MKSVILCEGGTDLTLIQYFLEKVSGWKYTNNGVKLGDTFGLTKRLQAGDDILDIGATKGCSNMMACLEEIFDTVRNAAKSEEGFDKIVIVTDRDEAGSEDEFAEKVKRCVAAQCIDCLGTVQNDRWVTLECENGKHDTIQLQLLMLVIPFEEQGAMETFLLKAIASKDEYDKEIIAQGNQFVDTVDKENRYLTKRRFRTKAKFDVYFSVRTALEQFQQRKDILKGIPWEDYEDIQHSFGKLRELHTISE